MEATPAFKKYEYVLKIIQRHRQDKVHYLLKAVDKKVIKAIVEIAYNLIKGDIPLSKSQISKLRCNKATIKYLINKQKSLDQKREILCENPKLLRYMLKIVLN